MASNDFIRLDELTKLTGFSAKCFYNVRLRGTGPLAGILTKFGGYVGVWRSDYDALVRSQRRLPDPAPAARHRKPRQHDTVSAVA